MPARQPAIHATWTAESTTVCAMMGLALPSQDMHNDIQDVLGQSYGVPDDIDEDDLMGELDALEEDMAQETEHAAASGVPSYLQVRASSSGHRARLVLDVIASVAPC